MPCGQIDYHTAFYIRLSKIMLHNRNDRRASVSRLLNNYTHRAKNKEQFSLDASNCSQPKRSLPHLNRRASVSRFFGRNSQSLVKTKEQFCSLFGSAQNLTAHFRTLIYNFWVFGGGFDVIGFYVVFAVVFDFDFPVGL